METRDTKAPDYKTLRPFKKVSTDAFPVYPNLVADLAAPTSSPDPKVAHVLGTCAGYSYADEQTLSMIMARLGLEDVRCRAIIEKVDAMFICSTAFILQSKCGRVAILSYRGTEPTNVINWLTDAEVDPEKVEFGMPNGPASFLVHAGFYRNVRATRYEVMNTLSRALEGKSVHADGDKVEHPLEALYVTGHSLGGAMAAMMAVMLTTVPEYAEVARKLRGVYTFGQPMIGDRALAKSCDADPFLGKKVFRYVYRHDVVPALPPAASGDFEHFGPEYRATRSGHDAFEPSASKTEQVPNLLQLPAAAVAFLARQTSLLRDLPFQYSFDDHGPQHYITALTPMGVRSEYGDF